jgi:2'-5' RNA ligase
VPLVDRARGELERHLSAAVGEVPGRAVAPDNWHLTLRFLGNTGPDHRAALQRGLTGASLGEAFRISFGTLGAFPSPASAAVLWIAIDRGADALEGLASRVEAVAQASGFPPENRRFQAHLTLSRLRPKRDVRPIVERSSPAGIEQEVTAVVLFQSHLSQRGPRYEALASYPLAT